MHWHHALCGLGVTQEVLGNIFSDYLDKGGLPGLTQKTRCESLWGKLEDLYKEHTPTSQIQTLGITKFKKQVMVQLFLPMPKQQGQGTWHHVVPN